MPDKNQTSQEAQVYPEETINDDLNVGKTGVDKEMLRVEGQNENIKTPPQEVQAAIAATARDTKDILISIEDES